MQTPPDVSLQDPCVPDVVPPNVAGVAPLDLLLPDVVPLDLADIVPLDVAHTDVVRPDLQHTDVLHTACNILLATSRSKEQLATPRWKQLTVDI